MIDAEKIAEEARNSISKYCFEECGAYCCRKGYLVLTEEEAKVVTRDDIAGFLKNNRIKKIKDNKYSFYLGDYNHQCPCLKDLKCIAHKDPNRPLACRQFPVFIEGKNLRLSPRCLAVKNNLLYPYVAKLVKNGFKIIEGDAFADLELYNFNP